jgi:hypothetical protein
MRCNVDLLKIIQIGLTLSDEDGNYPQDVSTWQFNFHFSIECVFSFLPFLAENSCDPPHARPLRVLLIAGPVKTCLHRNP